MTSELSLPVIDIRPYLPSASPPDTQARAQTSSTLHLALRDVGFFYLDVSSYLSEAERQQVLDLGKEFFDRPAEEKETIAIDGPRGDGARGYQRLKQNITRSKPDHHEGLDLYAPSPFPPTSVGSGERIPPLAGQNQWPAQPANFQPVMEHWIEKMHVLGMAVMEAMSDALQMTPPEWAHLRSLIDPSFWVMRVIGYPPLPSGSEGISCGAHKDYGCLTLLHQSPHSISALQVLLRSPTNPEDESLGTWINADPLPNCLVVNVGSMIEQWTHGLYKATLHRVVHKGERYRVSIPFFFEPKWDAVIEVLPAAVRLLEQGEGGGRGVKGEYPERIVYGEYLLGKVGGNFAVGGEGKGKYD